MRVLLLGSYPPPYGGVQVHMVTLRRYMLAHSIPCSVINTDRHRDEDTDQVFYPRSALNALWLLLRLPYDVAHLHVGGDLTTRLLLLGLICSWLPWKKSILTFHSGGYPTSPAGRSTSRWSFRGFVLRQFDRVIGVNDEIVTFFRRAGVAEARARMIEPHAVFLDDTEELLSGERESVMGEQIAHFFDRHDPVLVAVGLLEPEYNLSLQIEAMAMVLEDRPGAGLVIIGSGSLEAELRELIAAKPYGDNIVLCGDVGHRATLRVIADCDLLLRPTAYDGDAISVREALHFGTRVLASDNGMRPEGVWLLDRLDPGTLATTISAILDSPTEGLEARSDDSNLEKVVAVYEELTAPVGN